MASALNQQSRTHDTLKHIMYDDPLHAGKMPWLRVFMRESSGGQQMLHAQCWLCANFNPNTGGRQQLGKANVGLAIGGVQIGQLHSHVINRKGEPAPEHRDALARYQRQCKQWIFEEWGEAEADTAQQADQLDIKASVDKWRESIKIERLNHVHAAYESVYLFQSGREYERQVRSSVAKGAKYFPSMFGGRTWFENTVAMASNELFADTWWKLCRSPIIAVCTDEADGLLGVRVQYLDISPSSTRPASDYFQIRHLTDCSADGIFHATVNAFTSPSCRPDGLQDLVFTKRQFSEKLCGFIADGASVNGVAVSPDRGPRHPIEMAQEGQNIFCLLSALRSEHTPVPLLGVWCSPHRVDLLSDSLKDSDKKLPTFHTFHKFIVSLCAHLDWSGPARHDIAFLNTVPALKENETLKTSGTALAKVMGDTFAPEIATQRTGTQPYRNVHVLELFPVKA